MELRKLCMRAAVIGLIVLVPAAAFAADARTKAPKLPKSGTWRMTRIEAGDTQLLGTFKLKGKTISDFHGTIGADALLECGSRPASVSVTTKGMKIADDQGYDDAGGQYKEWAFGRNDLRTEAIVPKAVKIKHGGKTVNGSLMLIFSKGSGANGELDYDHDNCSMAFLIKHS